MEIALEKKYEEYIKYLKKLCGIKSLSSDRYESEIAVLKEQQKMKELYERIYIKTETDLPEPNEGYIVHYKGGIIEYFCYLDHSRDRAVWMKNIDWYFLPLKQDTIICSLDNLEEITNN